MQYRRMLPFVALVCSLAIPAFAGEKATFSLRTIQAQVDFLASDELRGRGTGDIGNDLAAQFIAEEFAKNGLKPLGTRRQRDPKAAMDGSGYYQPFAIEGGRVAGKKSRLEVRFGNRTVNYRPRSEFEPSGISAGGQAEGGVVFVGYGIHAPNENHDDYANVDVKDKVVLLLEGVPSNKPNSNLANFENIYRKAFAAREKGAVAVLAIRNPKSDTPSSGFDQREDAGIPVLRVRYPMAERWLSSLNIRIEDIQRQADAGRNVSAALGSVQARLAADVQKSSRITANILGFIEGSDPTLKNEVVVIGAHMDHLGLGGHDSLDRSGKPAIHHGADDNASGTTGVLQLAALFGPKSENGNPPRLKRSLLLMAYSGEEMGLLGSRHYVNNPILPLEKTVAMLNMDMIGRLKDNRLLVNGTKTAKEWNALLEETNKATYFQIAKSDDVFGASDHYSFYQKDIPVLFFFTGIHADYHRPSDTSEKINTTGLARILELVTLCTQRIADAPDRPTFQKMETASNPTENRPSRGFPVSIGIMPDYAAGDEGVLVGDVIAGRAAEKAGIQRGDVIVKFGAATIKNIQDYVAVLQNHKPGEVVEVTVKRGNDTLIFKVTLAASRR